MGDQDQWSFLAAAAFMSGRKEAASQVFESGCLGRNRAAQRAASSVSMLSATTLLPIASTAASYMMRAWHIALKFDRDLFRLNLISAHAMVP